MVSVGWLMNVYGIRRKGFEVERSLVKMLRKLGYKAVRIPTSASSGEPLPDVFATKGSKIVAFEVKYRSRGKARFRAEQVEKLVRFLELFDAYTCRIAALAVKFPRRWVFVRADVVSDYVVSEADESDFEL